MANEVITFTTTTDPIQAMTALNAAFDGTTQTALKAESANTATSATNATNASNLISTTNQDIGDVNFRAKTLQSDVPTGTAPLIITSTTKVNNLNADRLDGYEATSFALAGVTPMYANEGTFFDVVVSSNPVYIYGLLITKSNGTLTGLTHNIRSATYTVPAGKILFYRIVNEGL